MKLTRVTVRNFRSYVTTQGQPTPALKLGDGINLLVGPNNCGKSNLLRAISLALEDSGGDRFDAERDIPHQLTWAYPVITLGFRCEGRTAVERTLLRLARDYERSAGASTTSADENEIVLRVTYRPSGRDESLAVKGLPNKKGDIKKLEKALSQFRKCIRFIYLRSGESLNNFLSGAFKELLHTVLQEHLAGHVTQANKRREEYISALTQELLTPLGNHAKEQLAEVMEEIISVTVEPFVPDLEETLSRANIIVEDTAKTTLVNKGTGVRGALLVALLGYLARHSRRSLILAVEEPESFLHPGAQQELRSDLAALAKRKDVTLLVTTHSPFLLDRSDSTTITTLKKELNGHTEIGNQITGNSPHAPVTSCLFGETITPTVLDSIHSLAADTKGIIFVEGFTDKFYLEAAAVAAEREELLDGLEIRFGDGAHKAAVQAILLRQMTGSNFPMGALFDHDDLGKSAASLLTEKFNWRGNHVVTYRKWKLLNPSSTPVEAEDMFPNIFIEDFLQKHPSRFLAEKMQYSDGTYHYGFTQDGKTAFVSYVRENLGKKQATAWIQILEYVRGKIGLHQTT